MIVAVPKNYVEKETISGHLGLIARPSISNPNATYSRTVAKMLSTEVLKQEWMGELETMAASIREGGNLLAQELDALGVSHGGVGKRSGMFAMLPCSPEQVGVLEKEQQVFFLSNGRINRAAIHKENVKDLATRIAKVL